MLFDWIGEFIRGLKNYNIDPPKPEPRAPSIPDFGFPSESALWSGVVIHHSATKDSPVGNDWEAIRRYHMSYRIDGTSVTEQEFERRKAAGQGSKFEKPWKDIGYHLGVEREAMSVMVKIGRPWTMAGAHAGLTDNATFNESYLGLCVVGGFDGAAPDQETWDTCLRVVRALMMVFKFPKTDVIGHREVYDRVGIPRAKTCPGAAFDMEKFRSEL